MKKIISVLFFLAFLAAVCFGNGPLAFVSLAALCLTSLTNRRPGYAYLLLVPAIMQNPITGQEIPPLTRAEKALFDFLRSKGNAITLEAIVSGDIVFDPISYYIRFVVTGLSGRQQIVSQSTSRIVGQSNIDQGYLPQYYNFCFDRVAIRYGSSNTSAAEVAQSITNYSSVASGMPAALRNGELIISSNKNVIVETPIIDFTDQAAVTGGGTREYSGGALEKPRFFEENKLIEVWLNLAVAQSIPSTANTTFAVEVVFMGVQTRLRS